MKSSSKLLAGILAGLMLGGAAVSAEAADVTIKYAGFGGKSPFYTRGIDPWREKVAAQSGGKVEVQEFINTLGGPTEIYKNTKDGLADIGWVVADAARGFKFPRSYVMSLPGILDGYSNKDASVALWRLYEKGLISDDYTDVVPIAFASMSPAHIITKDREPGLDDLAGVKLGVTDGLSAEVAKSLGAIPVFTPVTDLYQSMSRNTVDGMLVGFTAVAGFKLEEVSNRHLVMALNTPLVFIAANKGKLDSLPADAREALMTASATDLSTALGGAADGMVAYSRKSLSADPKQKIVDVPDAEKAAWLAKVQPVIDRWVEATPNGAAILAAYKEELDAAKAGN